VAAETHCECIYRYFALLQPDYCAMQEITQKTAITGRNDCYRETEICCQQKLATLKEKKKKFWKDLLKFYLISAASNSRLLHLRPLPRFGSMSMCHIHLLSLHLLVRRQGYRY